MKKMVKTLACVLTTTALLFAVTGCPKTTDEETPATTNHYLKVSIDETGKAEGKPVIQIKTNTGTTKNTITKVTYKIKVPSSNVKFQKLAVAAKGLSVGDSFVNTTVATGKEWGNYVKYDLNNAEPTADKWTEKTVDFSNYEDISYYKMNDVANSPALDSSSTVLTKWQIVSLEGYAKAVTDKEYVYLDDIVITYGDGSTNKYDMEDEVVPANFTITSDSSGNNTATVVTE